MKGIAAHYVYNTDKTVKKNGLILIDSDNCYKGTFDFNSEIHSTVFYNGLIIPAFEILIDDKTITGISQVFSFIIERHNEDLIDILENYAVLPSLLPGRKYDFWCFENIDLSTLKLTEETKLVFV